ncbi:unnamed protein product (macronuclear) [Paramecium tetraurelia]|uniref:Uncharacterized protein n=1 Tax=Paramecium tetraurelia TaxID=5888 RepID=A0CJW8_PARTE|nr:uncharacterized protein GSPATT00000797001 [Paramecium tetraurelia]CAK71085.1 unnamed protein product [Paramecium tetraurelia]|eukprot:XP_001438482.1 hypothetical protein (macronuclear) [Paramecium tetraurelia strain d4-2]
MSKQSINTGPQAIYQLENVILNVNYRDILRFHFIHIYIQVKQIELSTVTSNRSQNTITKIKAIQCSEVQKKKKAAFLYKIKNVINIKLTYFRLDLTRQINCHKLKNLKLFCTMFLVFITIKHDVFIIICQNYDNLLNQTLREMLLHQYLFNNSQFIMDQAGYNHSQIQSVLNQSSNLIKKPRIGQQGSISQTETFYYKENHFFIMQSLAKVALNIIVFISKHWNRVYYHYYFGSPFSTRQIATTSVVSQSITQSQPLLITPSVRIAPTQPNNAEVHHQERPLQVVTMDDMDSRWKTKCSIQKSNSKNQGADDEIRLLKKKINSLTNDLKNSQEQNEFKDHEIHKLKLLMNDKDNELESLYQRIRALELIVNYFYVRGGRIMEKEINSDISEKLTMAETQLEALRNSKVTVTKESEIKRTGPSGTALTTQFETSSIKGATIAPEGYSTYGTNNSGRNSVVRNSGYNDRKQL